MSSLFWLKKYESWHTIVTDCSKRETIPWKQVVPVLQAGTRSLICSFIRKRSQVLSSPFRVTSSSLSLFVSQLPGQAPLFYILKSFHSHEFSLNLEPLNLEPVNGYSPMGVISQPTWKYTALPGCAGRCLKNWTWRPWIGFGRCSQA